jgi:hypothetical protein
VAWLATAWKVRDLGYLLAIAGLVAWGLGLKLTISDTGLRLVSARLEAEQRAAALSDELVIEQAKAMAVNERTAVQYVDRIRTIRVAAECPPDERDRAASRGVRDLVRGAPDAPVGGPPAPLQGPRAGARP